LPEDTPSTLHERIQEAERRLYPRVISALATGRITTQGRQVRWRST
jgi:folate-dependent phosphoribosylglycinamide formyltransferase PurN